MRVILPILGVLVLVIAFTTLLPDAPKEFSEKTITVPPLATPIIRATDPKRGNPNAPVVLYEFGDFACPACREAQPIIHEALRQFPDKVLHVWKDFPLPIHPNAIPMHVAAQCANDQGKFWEYHDALFTEQPYAEKDFVAIALTLGLDTTQFTTCQNDATLKERVQKSFAEGRLLSINETPYFFVNGERVVGTDTLIATIKKYVP